MRPTVHFSTKNGWMNDPNGLIYLDGVYHMFYQYNPAEPNWGNMHWGHAESVDLIHWEEKDTAIFPDGRGTIFSGCAVLDEKNLLGKNIDEKKAALLIYTKTDEPFCQNLSYSVDNFISIEEYSNNPVVPHIKSQNRDPKVAFCDELDCYIMALYLDGDEYVILKSFDLQKWTTLQNVKLECDNECPDIFPIYDNDGNRKWVFIGSNDKYLVGNFESGKFEAEQPVLSLHYGSSGYAGQTFNNMYGGRIIRMVWDRWFVQAENFKGQMGVPMEMSLVKNNGIYYLQANPVDELRNIVKSEAEYCDVEITAENEFKASLEKTAHLITLKCQNLNAGQMTLTVFGVKINFDFGKNELRAGDSTAPISVTNGGLDLTAVIDRCSIELFADGGKVLLSCINNDTVNDFNLPYLSIKASEPITLDCLKINSLNSIWD